MTASRRTLPALLLGVLAVFSSQQALAPVLPPLAREVGLPEVAVGLVITVAAALFAATAVLWGRAVDRLGHRTVLLAGTAVTLVALIGFALVVQAALAEVLDPGATLVLMVVTRSVLFGLSIGAVPVAATALVAATTPDEGSRTRGIGQIGAVQGLAIALGPALAGLFGGFGLLGPVWLAPGIVALALVVLLLVLPSAPRHTAPRRDRPRQSLKPWNPRLWPVLLTGFGLYLALSVVLIVLGFLVQDRLGLDAAGTVTATGAGSFVAGIVLVLVQGLVVPRLAWPAARLLRTGAPVALVGVVLLLVSGALWTIVLALAVLAVGMGLAAPGYVTAPTLLVGPEEQGAVAGLVQTVTGATFMLGPLLGSALYGIAPLLPLTVAAVACALGAVFGWFHPALRPAAARA